MNQILITNTNYIYNNVLQDKDNIKSKKTFFVIFIISIMICIFLFFYLFYSYFNKLYQNKKNNILKSKYIISTLYNENTNYDSIKISENISIIGLIDIPKINISYPILSNSNTELLKLSVCRFSGPSPNRIGNLCIAGHNYKNNMMFSNLYKLDINDSIFITDLNNTKLEYIIYDKFKVKQNNLTCTQNTNNVEITLITCNSNNNTERIVLKAKMKGY